MIGIHYLLSPRNKRFNHFVQLTPGTSRHESKKKGRNEKKSLRLFDLSETDHCCLDAKKKHHKKQIIAIIMSTRALNFPPNQRVRNFYGKIL